MNNRCAQYTDMASCQEIIACQWAEVTQTSLEFMCASNSPSSSYQERCKRITNDQDCQDQQPVCLWRYAEVAFNPCLNNGLLKSCKANQVETGLISYCEKQVQLDCLAASICSWNATAPCVCPDFYHGSRCEKPRFQWNARGGLCLASQANETFCNGLGIATELSLDHPLCSDSPSCQQWYKIKDLVGKIWTAEVINIYFDGFGVLAASLSLLHVLRRLIWGIKEPARVLKTALVSNAMILCITFIVDVSLEIVVLSAATGAAVPLGAFKDSFCFSQGDGYSLIVLLHDLTGSIATLSSVSIGIAVIGFLGDICSLILALREPANEETHETEDKDEKKKSDDRDDASDSSSLRSVSAPAGRRVAPDDAVSVPAPLDAVSMPAPDGTWVSPVPGLATPVVDPQPKPAEDQREVCQGVVVFLVFLSSLGELVLGLVDFNTNTAPFRSGIEDIENAISGKQELDDGYICVQRHPDLPAADVTAVAIDDVLIVGLMVAGGALALLIYLAGFIFKARKKHARVAMDGGGASDSSPGHEG